MHAKQIREACNDFQHTTSIQKAPVKWCLCKHIPSADAFDPLLQIYKEETFGPAVPLFKFKHDEEAIKLANDTIYGLASYFYTRVSSTGT